MNLENYGVTQMTVTEMENLNGGSFWKDLIKEVAVDVCYQGLKALGSAIVDHCNNGAGYGGAMDRHGKL